MIVFFVCMSNLYAFRVNNAQETEECTDLKTFFKNIVTVFDKYKFFIGQYEPEIRDEFEDMKDKYLTDE